MGRFPRRNFARPVVMQIVERDSDGTDRTDHPSRPPCRQLVGS
jgi:hypothetical protein